MHEGAEETLSVPAVSIVETNVVVTNVDPSQNGAGTGTPDAWAWARREHRAKGQKIGTGRPKPEGGGQK